MPLPAPGSDTAALCQTVLRSVLLSARDPEHFSLALERAVSVKDGGYVLPVEDFQYERDFLFHIFKVSCPFYSSQCSLLLHLVYAR